MSIEVRLKTDAREITTGILKAVRSQLNTVLHQTANNIRLDILKLIDKLVEGSPEYQSLINGELSQQLGLNDIDARLKDIVGALKNSVGVSVVPVSYTGDKLRGGVNIHLIKSDFEDVLGLSAASYQTGTTNIPWLEWLLTQGDRIILANYPVSYQADELSRMNRGTVPVTTVLEKGGGWRIPPQFSGTLENNWLTRTFNVGLVKTAIDQIVERRLRG